ncbi:MAG: PD-(D/E)XK nuclease family protein, partial [Chloroflexi bacterium]|nr:PD-(D/E)XK nuclease family protein [Chloroflexota bacterium]
MSLRLLLSPAAHGKTQSAIERIRAVLDTESLAPVTVILPNQIRVAEFRRRLAAAGGAMGVNLVTFHTLYAELLARAGQPKARLLDPVQVRLLRAIVDRFCQDGSLRHYAPLRAKPGFVAALRGIIQELKRARIEPDDFSAAVIDIGPRLQEIAAIYAAYQDWLLRQNWADPEGQGWLAAIALDENPALGSELRLLVVNGFDEFNPTQLGVLTLLAQRSHETLITLTGDSARPHRLAHRRFHRAQQALIAVISPPPSPPTSPALLTSPAPPLIIPTFFGDPASPAHSPLAHLESHLFESPLSNLQSPISNLHFIEAQTRSAEARSALRWVKARIVRDGLALSEVAILARSLDPYRPFLEEIAAEFGVPLRIIGGLPLAENPAVAALLALLSLPALDWPRRPVLEVWRSPYFDWSAEGISPGDATRLDAATRLGRVTSGLDQWREAFDLLAKQNPPDPLIADEEGFFPALTPSLSHGERESDAPLPVGVPCGYDKGLGVREIFDAFITRLTPPPHATIRDYAAFVEDLIGDDPALATRFASLQDDTSLRVVARARENSSTAERDVAALRALKDVLRGLVLAESVLDTDTLDYSAFFDDLRGAVEAASYLAAPESGVLAASVLDARGLSFRAVVILGLSEGEFPQTEREYPFLRESDRAVLRERGLPIEPKLRGDEASFFYQAVTRAREQLLLCRPYLADDGQPWEPSPYWLHVWRMFGEPQPRRMRPEDPPPQEEAASRFEFAQAGGGFDIHLGRGASILQTRLTGTAVGPHEGDLSELSPSLAIRYSPSFGWSASKLEAYGTCPFYFYIGYALGLEPRTPPEEGYDVRILGNMLHQILEFTYARAADPTDLDECLR